MCHVVVREGRKKITSHYGHKCFFACFKWIRWRCATSVFCFRLHLGTTNSTSTRLLVDSSSASSPSAWFIPVLMNDPMTTRTEQQTVVALEFADIELFVFEKCDVLFFSLCLLPSFAAALMLPGVDPISRWFLWCCSWSYSQHYRNSLSNFAKFSNKPYFETLSKHHYHSKTCILRWSKTQGKTAIFLLRSRKNRKVSRRWLFPTNDLSGRQ